jgi:hypothetical protein
MIFLASLPSGVFLATWDRNISPVAFHEVQIISDPDLSSAWSGACTHQVTRAVLFLNLRCLSPLAWCSMAS